MLTRYGHPASLRQFRHISILTGTALTQLREVDDMAPVYAAEAVTAQRILVKAQRLRNDDLHTGNHVKKGKGVVAAQVNNIAEPHIVHPLAVAQLDEPALQQHGIAQQASGCSGFRCFFY